MAAKCLSKVRRRAPCSMQLAAIQTSFSGVKSRLDKLDPR
jgi:hypothetical protein